MVKKAVLRRIRIFIGYTSDLRAERKAIDKVIARLQDIANERGLIFNVVDWHNAIPDAGLPENVILHQLAPHTWDIFIGILWHRFGTPTGIRDNATGKEYLSGTAQEYHLAYHMWEHHSRPRVSFYRSERKANLHDIDTEQFQLVKDFIAQFAAKGSTPGLYQTFNTIQSFEDLIHRNLTQFLLARRRASIRKTAKTNDHKSLLIPPNTTMDLLGSLILRGIKETYYRTLDKRMRSCPPVRLNIMVPNQQENFLQVRFVDDSGQYTSNELTKKWLPGEGKCGAAWTERTQQIYASDTNAPERFLEPMDASTNKRLIKLQSVVSTPIKNNGRIVGVLNFDSKHNSSVTRVQDEKILALLSKLADQIGELLADAVNHN